MKKRKRTQKIIGWVMIIVMLLSVLATILAYYLNTRG